jgi:DNA-binding NarL/FixJ family response regulator
MSVRILLADDHKLLRQTLRRFLESEDEFELVGEAGDGRQALEAVAKLQPDILLLDIMMPGLNGLEVTRRVRQDFPDTRVLVLSMHPEKAYVVKALQNGASGYVVKQADVTDLIDGVRAVARGERYVSPRISHLAIEALERELATATFDPYETLSTREREVFQLVAEGCTSPEVGARLYISTRTVETHRANISRKLGVRNQTELLRFAIERGLIEVEPQPTEGAEPSGESDAPPPRPSS